MINTHIQEKKKKRKKKPGNQKILKLYTLARGKKANTYIKGIRFFIFS